MLSRVFCGGLVGGVLPARSKHVRKHVGSCGAQSPVVREVAYDNEESDEIVDQNGDLWNSDYNDIVTATPMLDSEQVAGAMYDSVHENAGTYFKSFYSSVVGGILTDPALMCLPIDDHMVHRGHGVFDTAIVVGGSMYQLDEHVARLYQSAQAAKIELPFSIAKVKRILLDTAAAGRSKNGFLRFWLSAGRGGFGLSGSECLRPEFYCIFYNGPHTPGDETKGWSVKTSTVPNKHGKFAEMKSVNYMQNALNLMEAQEAKFDQGIFMFEDGSICEGPNMNIGIVTKEGIVKTPPFESCLAGCTMQRLLDLIPEFADGGELEGVNGFEQVTLTEHDIEVAQEVFMTSSTLPVTAVTHWNGKAIADGTVGISALALRQMMLNDLMPRPDSDQHTPVPYGVLTGMPEDTF